MWKDSCFFIYLAVDLLPRLWLITVFGGPGLITHTVHRTPVLQAKTLQCRARHQLLHWQLNEILTFQHYLFPSLLKCKCFWKNYDFMEIFLTLVWNNLLDNFPISLTAETGPKRTEHRELATSRDTSIDVPMTALGGKQRKPIIRTWAEREVIRI